MRLGLATVWHGFHGTGRNLDITNEISARAMMNNLNVEIKVGLNKIGGV